MESYEMAKSHFDKLSSSPEGQKELSKFDVIMQFNLKDDDSFFIEIKSGKVTVTRGKATGEPHNIIGFLTDRATVREIFQKGQLYPGLSDFMFEGKVWVMGPKSGAPLGGEVGKPKTAWAGKLLRMHV